jgi:hypothetical protein
MSEIMTTTAVARWFTDRGQAVKPWHVRRVFENNAVPEPPYRMGAYRVVPHDWLPRIEVALREAGYIAADAPSVTESTALATA